MRKRFLCSLLTAALILTQISAPSVFAESEITMELTDSAQEAALTNLSESEFSDSADAEADESDLTQPETDSVQPEGITEAEENDSEDIITDTGENDSDQADAVVVEAEDELGTGQTAAVDAAFGSGEEASETAELWDGSTGTVDFGGSDGFSDGESKNDNISNNSYSVYGSTSYSYLVDRGNGLLERIQYVSGTGVIVAKYQDGVYQSSQVIGMELSIFGGFYSGTNYNFLVFGQKNTKESDECEVVRVVRYSKDWKRQSVCSIYGANTYIPFDAGSLDMTETGGKLYIHTCHEMYQTSDGLHHQANMTFVVNEEKMEVADSYYGIMNISWGYVSHSFNQYIQTDGEYVYRVDHGDAYPRGLSVTKVSVNAAITSVAYTVPMYFRGATGNNATWASVGGFELSSDSCVIVGNSADQSAAADSTQRNIFVVSVSKDLKTSQTHWLTEYQEGSGITVKTPQIVKVSDSRFLVLWEEYDGTTEIYTTKLAMVDADGVLTSAVVSTYYSLSDCQPIVTADGNIQWYVVYNGNMFICSVNPDNLGAFSETEDAVIRDRLWTDGTVQGLKADYVENIANYRGSAGYLTISWDAVDGAECYEIKIKEEGSSYYTTYKTDDAANSYRIRARDISKPGELMIRACKTGYHSAWSSADYAGWSEEMPKLLSGCTVTPEYRTCTYDGAEKKPSVQVMDQNTALTEGTDYVLVGYTDNVNAGTAAVTVEGKGKYAGTVSGTFIILKAYPEISIERDELTYGEKTQIKVTQPESASYESYKPAVATVDSNGVVTAVGAGKTYIVVECSETDNYCSNQKYLLVTVNRAEQEVTASISPISIRIGETAKVTASAPGGNLSYYSSRSSVASVSADGIVTGIGAGTATITVTAAATSRYETASAQVKIKVTSVPTATKKPAVTQKPTIKPTKVPTATTTPTVTPPMSDGGEAAKRTQIISASDVVRTSAAKKQSFYLNAACLDNAKLTYNSSTSKVKVSSAGKVTVAKNFVGKATITIKARATSEYQSASTKITVTVKPQKRSITKLQSTAKGKITVKWKKDTAVTGYQIQYSTSSNFKKGVKKTTVAEKSAVSLTKSGFSKGKTWYVRMRSYKKTSAGTVYSGWSTVKKVKVKK